MAMAMAMRWNGIHGYRCCIAISIYLWRGVFFVVDIGKWHCGTGTIVALVDDIGICLFSGDAFLCHLLATFATCGSEQGVVLGRHKWCGYVFAGEGKETGVWNQSCVIVVRAGD